MDYALIAPGKTEWIEVTLSSNSHAEPVNRPAASSEMKAEKTAGTGFASMETSLSGLTPVDSGRVLEATSDVALVIDSQGLIQDLAFGSADMSGEGFEGWIGRPWIDTVTVESRPKVAAMLADAGAGRPPRWRQVNHPTPAGTDVPVMYSAVPCGRTGRVIAVGRDLRGIAQLQQRLVDAQQAIEQDYWRLRHAETRYRLLFEMASEALLIVDAAHRKIVEVNPAAAALLGEPARRLTGQSFPRSLDDEGTRTVSDLLDAVKVAGRADAVQVRQADRPGTLSVSASIFQQDGTSLFLVRLSPRRGAGEAPAPDAAKLRMLQVIDNSPDAMVVTDLDGRVILANRTFLDLSQVPHLEQARGQSLDRWFGRPGVDLNVLLANLRRHGSVKLFATTLRGEFGAASEVEISAVAVTDPEAPCHGFVIRNVGPRLGRDTRAEGHLPRSVQQLTELVGRVSLKELVREATDVIERLCIEAALEVTGDNRASAAEMLGLSRQSLYVKLRRYGLGESGDVQQEQ